MQERKSSNDCSAKLQHFDWQVGRFEPTLGTRILLLYAGEPRTIVAECLGRGIGAP
jgi:hypothetical protein